MPRKKSHPPADAGTESATAETAPPAETPVAATSAPAGDPAEQEAAEGATPSGLEEFVPEPPHNQNEVWIKRIPWELVPLNRIWGVYAADGQFRAYSTPPLRAEGHDGDWFVDDGDFDTLIAADVMPDFAEEYDWRTSLCKRPEIPASPFDEAGNAGAGAVTEAPCGGVIPAAPGAWGRFMELMSEPGYMEGVFADRAGIKVEENPTMLNAMGASVQLFMRLIARHIPKAYPQRATPTLKCSASLEFDLTGAAPKVTGKIRSTVKSEEEDEIIGRNPLQSEMNLDTRTAAQREEADMNAIIAAENEPGNQVPDESPQPEPGGEPERDAFADCVDGQPHSAEQLQAAQEALSELATIDDGAEADVTTEDETKEML